MMQRIIHFKHHFSWSRFCKNKRGVAAIEFALIFPIMITLYIGLVDLTTAINVSRKVSHTANTLADLFTQAQTINDNSQAQLLMDAATAIMVPYPTDNVLQIDVLGLSLDSAADASIAWVYKRNSSSAYSKDTSYNELPSQFKGQDSGSEYIFADSILVVAKVKYTHTPFFSQFFIGPVTFDEEFYYQPRHG